MMIDATARQRKGWHGMDAFLCPRKIVIHHSATDEGDVATFRRYHVDGLKWSDVGYHFVIDNNPDGQIQHGRPVTHIGAHARGHNAYTIGVCLVGDGTPPVTRRQLDSLVVLLTALCETYKLDPRTTIVGHRELMGCSTDCPGDHIMAHMATIRDGVALRMKTDGMAWWSD